MTVEDIKRIIAYKKARLESLVQPDMWIRYTKNMESGEIKEFKQYCIDDEIIIEALEKQIPKKVVKKNPICYMRRVDGVEFYAYDYHCSVCDAKLRASIDHHCICGQAIDWSDSE